MPSDAWKTTVLRTALLIALTALLLSWMGRLPFCKCGVISLWSGDTWSNQNSQQLFDPYTFTHIIHGTALYALIWIVAGNRMPRQSALLLAVALECGWELLENTEFIIDRYRAETMSLDYYGDSIFNSIGDVLAMVAGFELARRLPVVVTVVGTIALDLLLLVFIRDSLAVNIIMLIYPLKAIKEWQLR